MPQSAQLVSDEELNRISMAGFEIYNRKLKAILEPEYVGQDVAIHLDTEDYEVAPGSSRARSKLRSRHPEGLIVTTDIGQVDSGDPLRHWLRAEKGWRGDMETIPARELDALIIAAAKEAAEDYRADPELRAFHALDGEDFLWHE